MTKRINFKFSLALTASIILHIGLIAVLSYSAWQYSSPYTGDIKGESIEAIMVDSRIMTEQYQRQLQHQLTSKKVEQQQQQQIEKQARELQEKQLAEQQRLKEIEKERLLAQEKQKQEAIEKARLEEQQRQQALIAKQKAEEEAKLKAQKALEEKQRLEAERKRAELVAKQKKADEEAKLKAQKALEEQKRQQALNDILGGLTSSIPKSQQGVSTAEEDQFKSQVSNAIRNKFINPKLYDGKNCVLDIQLAPDGLLLSVSTQEGDAALCREAISATKLATFPNPKSDRLYQRVKNLTIDFRPR